jgi:uncharacterized protein (TIGR00299 family) protein
MTIAYFDCFSGLCGDMILGALIDLGIDFNDFKNEIKKLNIDNYDIKYKKIKINNLSGSDIRISFKDNQPNRNLKDINKLIEDSSLKPKVKKISMEIFQKLGYVESKIHNIDIKNIHFHEIGAIDSIIDIVGTIICLNKLNIKDIYCSPLPLGKGFINCSHGIIPIPAPATMELLKNIPIYQTDRNQELVTPTGAAIITTITKHFDNIPMMKIIKIGYGSGKVKSRFPNLLRIIVGEK